VSNFFFSLILQHIKKKLVISFGYYPKYISSIKKQKEKRKEKKIFQRDVYWFLLQKTKQGKIRPNQTRN
jgi:hypothetical protein